jgi:spermidine/putrescine transport system substrate-binding protein
MTSGVDPRDAFLAALRRWQRGSISRRHFLGTTGVAAAVASLAAAMPELAMPRHASAAVSGSTLRLATWANYHDPKNFEAFAAETGIAVETEIFTSDDEMLAHLRSGKTGWDVIVAGDCRIEAYVQAGLLQPLETALIPSYQPQHYVDIGYTKPGIVNGRVYGVQKDWGTTGFCIDTGAVPDPVTGWKYFWNLARGRLTRRVTVTTEPLALIGSALKFYGYSFASNDEKELAEAELLLLDAKTHLLAVTDDPQPALRSGEASAAMAGTGDAKQLHKDIPAISYVIGREGGQIWGDYYAMPRGAPHRTAGHALIDFLLTPEHNRDEVLAHGYAVADERVLALLPPEILADPIMFPARELLQPLEFAAAASLTNPRRAQIMTRFLAGGGGR